MSASSVTDVYYIMRKATKSKEKALDGILEIAKIINFAEVNEGCIFRAFISLLDDRMCRRIS